MEYKSIKVSKAAYPSYVDEMEMFGWKLEKSIEDKDDNTLITLNFIRDPKINNYEELKQLEDSWFSSFDIPKFFPIVILIVIAFICYTALLVICMVYKYNFNDEPWLFALLGGGLLFTTLAFIYFVFRTKTIKRLYIQGEEKRNQIREKVKSLKDVKKESNS